MWSDFKTFINKGNVIQLAVAFVMGVAFTAIVTSFVKDITMPLISLVTGGLDFGNWFVSLNGKTYATLAAAQQAGAATLNFGVFLNAILTFIIIAFAMFLLVRIYEATQPKAAVETKDCPFCVSKIPLGATRCPACTSDLPAAEAVPT